MAVSTMTKGKRDSEYPGSFGFTEWNLDARADFDSLLNNMIAQGMKIATEEYECGAYFRRENPLEIRVELPCGPNEDEGPAWIFSLAELVENEIEMFTVTTEGNRIALDEEGREWLGRLSHALGRLQDTIDRELTRSA
jgi:hypothetical protein